MSSLSIRPAVAGLLSLLFSSVVHAQTVEQTPPAASADELTEARVVQLAAEHNPGLKSSLLELESARWEVSGLEAQYAPVLVLDASAAQTQTPTLLLDTVNVNRVRRGDAGAELRKHLIWGTDLSLRVSGSYQLSSFSRGFGLTPAGDFGPGYGLIAKLSLKDRKSVV